MQHHKLFAFLLVFIMAIFAQRNTYAGFLYSRAPHQLRVENYNAAVAFHTASSAAQVQAVSAQNLLQHVQGKYGCYPRGGGISANIIAGLLFGVMGVGIAAWLCFLATQAMVASSLGLAVAGILVFGTVAMFCGGSALEERGTFKGLAITAIALGCVTVIPPLFWAYMVLSSKTHHVSHHRRS